MIFRRRPAGTAPDGRPRREEPVGAVQDLAPPFEIRPDGELRGGGWCWRVFRLDPEPAAPVEPDRAMLRAALVDPLPVGFRLRLWRAVRFDAAGREAYLAALLERGLGGPLRDAYVAFLAEEPLSVIPAVYVAVGWPADRAGDLRPWQAAAEAALAGTARLVPLGAAEVLGFLGILARLEVVR